MNSTFWLNKVMSTMYPTATDAFYVGLSSTEPSKTGTNVTEPSGKNYARVKVTGFTAPTEGTVKNTAEIVFPRSTGIWFADSAKAKYWVLFDGSAGSAHVLSSGALNEPKTIETDTIVSIPAQAMSVTLLDYPDA